MSNRIKLFLLCVCFVYINCEIYQERPKIKTSDGNLILEPAYDKNLYLVPNGPNSGIFVGETNILETKNDVNDGNEYSRGNNDFDTLLNGPNGVIRRLETLESKTVKTPDELLLNISTIWSKVNTINRKVLNLKVVTNRGSADACLLQPCQHGGTCLNLGTSYHCLCLKNWEGKNCDTDVNECRNFAGTDLGCQNGATCINRPGSYECLCRSGWYGLHCTRKEKDCSGGDFEMCGHGTCIQVSSGVGIKCICHQGWTTNGTGVECLTDIKECESGQGQRCSTNPKVDCVNLPGSYQCGQCPAGYQGDGHWCSDIDECTTIRNGGCSPLVQCHNTIGSRICGSCPPGYLGDGVTCTWRGSCNIQHGGCHPSARCIEGAGLYGQAAQCICPNGMDGDGIGMRGCYVSVGGNSTQRCESNPCGAHGQCHPLRNGYTCICNKGFGGAHCEIPVDNCANNPCKNGATCRPDETSTRGFRCECSAQFSGRLCQVRSQTCGDVLFNEEGSIVYPVTNSTYSHHSQCAWVIRTDHNKVINVTFSKFSVEQDPECGNDFLQIHDGGKSSSQLIGRFCGNSLPNGGNIVSSHNYLYLWFHSDATVAKDGFALHWISVDPVCGGDVDATTHGHISSPGSPGRYPPNRDCYWRLASSLNKKISLHFFLLDIESHVDCSFDYLAIYDGERESDPLLSKFCNSTEPAPVVSAGPNLLIHFHSDPYGSGKGFQIAYAPVDGVPGCGGYFTLDKGEITSPSYNGRYMRDLQCEYRIRTVPDSKIIINIKSFQLEGSYRCYGDYLKIYDGQSAESRLVGKFCGSTYPKTYVSSSNTLFIKFKSDHTISGKGFRLTYEAKCAKTITGDSGVIKSPGYPFTYPENKVCEYFIISTPGKAIQLNFQDFDIEDNIAYKCQYDYVEIRDGPDANATVLGKYCGGSAHIPPVATSTHNYMYIKFASDMSITGTGFYANYTTIDTECGGIYREMTGLINHPNKGASQKYKNSQSCIWVLIAPEGMRIKLTWNRFGIESGSECRNDYLQLIEIDDENTNTELGKFCGDRSPPTMTTTTNRLKLKFKSDVNVRSLGFSVSYTFLDERSHCDGSYIKSQGYIVSPGWPQPYEPNRDCTWVITVPAGRQIVLNISNFDLEPPVRDKCNLGDFLEIRDGSMATSPLIGTYCGQFQYRKITSLTNSIYLHFHSDVYLGGSGFRIEWDGAIRGCGGTLTSFSGSIFSPNYPNSYNDDTECFYRIITSVGSRIQLTFTDMELERTYNCKDDYVEIFDGRDGSAPSLGKYCIMTTNMQIKTSTNVAYIIFRSDIFGHGRGFLLNYNTLCNNNLTGRYGIIESPGYPERYPNLLDCLWNIKVPLGNKINITFSHFDIFLHPLRYRYWSGTRNVKPIEECSQDYLSTKEPTDADFSKKLCGNQLPQKIHTQSNELQIKFSTGSFNARSGFRLEWISDGCGGHIQKPSGTFSLDNELITRGNLECEWLIEAERGTATRITFTDAYIHNSNNCTLDAIEIYNGPNEKSPLLTKFCHQSTVSIQSDGNFIFVRFQKKSTLKDMHFKAKYVQVATLKCGGYVKSKSGFFHSKNFPKNYDDNMDCIWYISVPVNHRIEINFIDIDLYSDDSNTDYANEEVCLDAIYIYDMLTWQESNYTTRICPNSDIKQVIVNSNVATIQFKTNSEGTAKGFRANFTAICGGVINAMSEGTITNHQFVSYTNNSCIWTIIAPTLDQKISLTLTHISIPKNSDIITSRSCPSSFLRIYNGNGIDAPLVDEYCGRISPPMIISRGSALTIELGSYNDKVMGLFEAHYSPVTNACGGKLQAEKGLITSPNFPKPYPNGLNCEWFIDTSPGNTAFISIQHLDLEYSDGCNEDYLEIRERDGTGRLLGVYCGNTVATANNTIASKLYVSFHTNSYDSRTGFALYFEYVHSNLVEGDSGDIASPLYPVTYHGSAEFTWRISTSGNEVISINVKNLLIPSYEELSYNKLVIYDGCDQNAPVIEELRGMITDKIIQTTSNEAFIALKMDETNSGSLFFLSWTKLGEVIESETEKINCGSNHTDLVLPGSSTFFKSPNYPKNYQNNLNCEWVYRAEQGRHLAISFVDFQLEETYNCFADSVSIYSSANSINWKPAKENICTTSSASEGLNSSTYMKVKLKTDGTSNSKGFLARVASKCGGQITDLSGEITVTYLDIFESLYVPKVKCDWTIKVRPGRTIQMKFIRFNITNTNEICTTYIMLRNGYSAESPILANGKYCGREHENRDVYLTTTSNSAFLSYETDKSKSSHVFQSFVLRYEEKNVECGLSSKLTPDHNWEVISSPNNPSIPYTECEWVLTGPIGEILRMDFLGNLNLQKDSECRAEFVEIRDGPSNLSPLIGRYCGGNVVETKKTTNNVVYIKYSTQLAEPSNGFKLNVSIDVCGGTIKVEAGELSSPRYPHIDGLKTATVCEWRIIGPPRHTIKINVKDLYLPSDSFCASTLVIQETIAPNDTLVILKTLCNDELLEPHNSIETLTNEVTIKLTVSASSTWQQLSEYRGFKITFNSSRPVCGGTLTMSEGFLMSPSYPQETSERFCNWFITVPNKERRVRLELIDFNPEKQSIGIYDDLTFITNIITIGESKNVSSTNIYESTGRKIGMYVWLTRSTMTHRFKAHFTSNDRAICGGELSGNSGELISPNISRPYSCEWHISNVATRVNNTIYVTGKMNSSMMLTDFGDELVCSYYFSKLVIKSDVDGKIGKFTRKVCRNTNFSYRIPSTYLHLTANKVNTDNMYYELQWKVQPCGGVVYVSENTVNILNIPPTYNDTLECAWIIISSQYSRVELNMEGSFDFECDDQYVKITRTLQFVTPSLKNICKDNVLESKFSERFLNLYIEYHSKAYNKTNLKINVKKDTTCGGYIGNHQRVFSSPHFPNNYEPNQECVWEIYAEKGYSVSLQFIDTFQIEGTPNCTKDAVIIYDWKDEDYTEIARVCGRQPPPPINSTFDRMKVVLRTDSATNLPGFKAKWSSICGGNYIATETEQILSTPYSYRPVTCKYKISAPDKNILVKFLRFHLLGTYPECESEKLTVVARSDNNFYSLTKEYCGSETPQILSSYNEVSLTYNRTSFRLGSFMLSFSIFKCGGVINESRVLTSNYADTYDNDMNCTWLIEAPNSKVVSLKFLYIDLEGNADCDTDHVSVYEGRTVDNEKRLALLCGFINSTTFIRSKSNTLVLEFITDGSVTLNGFKVEVLFSYSESVGCGGHIELTESDTHVLKYPLTGLVYENYLDCEWLITSPPDTSIKINFTSFHISPCYTINQTALGYTKCDCDYVEIKDGINPNSINIGTYCGHAFPPQVLSSANAMSVILSTDGEYTSSGFEAILSTQTSVCGNLEITPSATPQRITAPVGSDGNVLRGLHCIYRIIDESNLMYRAIRFTILKFDLLPPAPDGANTNVCTRDKLVITNNRQPHNTTIGKDYVMHHDNYYNNGYFYDRSLRSPTRIELCGIKEKVDYYLYGSTSVHLITAAESDNATHTGVDLEVVLVGHCGRNYTESQGRIQSSYNINTDCYTLITAPKNYTISVYFITFLHEYWDEESYLDAFDGNTTASSRLLRTTSDFNDKRPIFSTGRYLLLHRHSNSQSSFVYDLNYVTTNRGRGCGGKLSNVFGRVTSPLYPRIYRQRATCEWELETPKGTRLELRFSEYDLGSLCDQASLQLVDSKGVVISTYCSETPADYISNDNYVKIVLVTTLNNSGRGFVAEFTIVDF